MSYQWTPERMAIWRRLKPAQRDYDRVIARRFPPGDGNPETDEYKAYVAQEERDRLSGIYEEGHDCRCHINPPCHHCVDCPVCTEEEE